MTGPKLTLVATPHAGGAGSAFLALTRALAECSGSAVQVLGVDLPGHGQRMAEPLLESIEAMARDILATIRPVIQRPYALFGHSMGALAAHRLVFELHAARLPAPKRLFVSSCAAPGRSRLSPEVARLPSEFFWRHVSGYNGMPSKFFHYPDLIQIFEPILRADIAAVAGYRPAEPERPTDVPITVLYGSEDDISPADLAAWQGVTSRPLELRRFPGGHFYLLEQTGELAEYLAQRCAEAAL